MSNKKRGLEALLTPQTSALILIDHQPFSSRILLCLT